MTRSNINNYIISIDESLREISALDELYHDIVTSDKEDELKIREEEARFARDRLLKLSLHVKNMIEHLKKVK